MRIFRNIIRTIFSLFSSNARRQLFSIEFIKQLDGVDVSDVLQPLYNKASNMDRINQTLYIDTLLLLSGNNLVKPNRMGMAVSIENRAPFLDYRMIELAFAVPSHLKLAQGVENNTREIRVLMALEI